MSVGAQMVVVLKAIVEHCVSLVLGHPFDFSWLEVSQTDVFHPFLLVSCDSESRSSSFCYQIVVRETENRQLFHFFWRRQRNLWVTDTFEWRPEAGLEGAPCVFFQGPALSLSKGRVAMLPTQLLPVLYNPVGYAFVVAALRREREGTGATHCVGDASEIKSPGHPARSPSSCSLTCSRACMGYLRTGWGRRHPTTF